MCCLHAVGPVLPCKPCILNVYTHQTHLSGRHYHRSESFTHQESVCGQWNIVTKAQHHVATPIVSVPGDKIALIPT